jgi:hypothetical protein
MGLSENTTNREPGESSMPGREFAPGVYNDPSGLCMVSLRIVEGGQMTPLQVCITS